MDRFQPIFMRPNVQTSGIIRRIQGFNPFINRRKNRVDLLLAKAKEQHQQGINGDKNAVKEAFCLLERIRLLDPGNHLAEAYYGSATALLGRDATDTQERTEKAKAGLKILDNAVSHEPDNIEIRTLRGYVSFRLPHVYFRRTKTAIEDFEYLVSHFEQNPNLFIDEFYYQLLYDLGVAYKTLSQDQDAETTWKKLLEKTSNPKYRDLISQKTIESN